MPRSQTALRALGAAALTTVALGTATPAHAADSYRYWGYYHLDGTKWAFAQKGVAETVPADGSVEGFRYAVGDGSVVRAPRAVQTFQEVCAKTDATAGKKRVGVIVDFGRDADARDAGATVPKPYAKCATVDPKATAADVLAAVATTRVENKMLCGIDGYPATGCSDVVKTLTAAQKSPDDVVALPDASAPQISASAPVTPGTSGSNAAKWAGIAAAVLAVAAIASALLSRRSRA